MHNISQSELSTLQSAAHKFNVNLNALECFYLETINHLEISLPVLDSFFDPVVLGYQGQANKVCQLVHALFPIIDAHAKGAVFGLQWFGLEQTQNKPSIIPRIDSF